MKNLDGRYFSTAEPTASAPPARTTAAEPSRCRTRFHTAAANASEPAAPLEIRRFWGRNPVAAPQKKAPANRNCGAVLISTVCGKVRVNNKMLKSQSKMLKTNGILHFGEIWKNPGMFSARKTAAAGRIVYFQFNLSLQSVWKIFLRLFRFAFLIPNGGRLFLLPGLFLCFSRRDRTAGLLLRR